MAYNYQTVVQTQDNASISTWDFHERGANSKRLWLARPGSRRDQCRVATEGATQRRSAVDPEIQSSHVRWGGHGAPCCGRATVAGLLVPPGRRLLGRPAPLLFPLFLSGVPANWCAGKPTRGHQGHRLALHTLVRAHSGPSTAAVGGGGV